jgi:aminoglycoside phosphotransferase (APT) family kinase protein
MGDTLQGQRGIDEPRVSTWLQRNVDGVEAPFTFRQLVGGMSNLTYEVRDATGRRMVLRRPPLGEILPSAHDMTREHRILTALGATSVPVPDTLGVCRDAEVNGAPFYVMDFAEGVILRDEDGVEKSFDPTLRPAIADSYIDALCDLHLLDPDAVGLGGLSQREGYISRQLRRWNRQYEASRSRTVADVSDAHRLLGERIPAQQRLAIVHGDYRIDNTVLGPDGLVEAVLDWELCTLGDPLADLGLLLLYWVEPGEDASFLPDGAPTRAAGFPDRGHLLARYADHSGADLSQIDFYIAFGSWKLACITEGVLTRFEAGVMGSDDEVSLERLAAQTPKLARMALERLERS